MGHYQGARHNAAAFCSLREALPRNMGVVMPYRIVLHSARRALGCKLSAKADGTRRFFEETTDQVEVKGSKGLLLFYRPRPVADNLWPPLKVPSKA
jgi:hypothetical protein